MRKNNIYITLRYLVFSFIPIILAILIYKYYIELGKDLGFQSFKLAIWAWYASLGWLVVALNVLNIKGLKFESYYNINNFDFERKIYTKFGVKTFKKFMFNGDYYNKIIRIFKPNYKIIRDFKSMLEWEKRSKTKEFAHVIHFLMAIAAFIYVLIIGYFKLAVYITIFNVLFNLYPIMLQRYNRIRIYKIIKKFKKLN